MTRNFHFDCLDMTWPLYSILMSENTNMMLVFDEKVTGAQKRGPLENHPIWGIKQVKKRKQTPQSRRKPPATSPSMSTTVRQVLSWTLNFEGAQSYRWKRPGAARFSLKHRDSAHHSALTALQHRINPRKRASTHALQSKRKYISFQKSNNLIEGPNRRTLLHPQLLVCLHLYIANVAWGTRTSKLNWMGNSTGSVNVVPKPVTFAAG